MLEYLLKRILLIVPTVFLILIIVFVIVCSAPGQPGEALSAEQATTQEQAGGGTSRKAFKAFKHHFGLDKPILFNFRPYQGEERVRELLATALAPEKPVERMRAVAELEDWGQEAVPHLVAIASDAGAATDLRHLALYLLPFTAQRHVERIQLAEGQREMTAAQREQDRRNQEIAAENALLKRHEFRSPAVFHEEGFQGVHVDFEEELAGFWRPWFAEREERFARGFWGRLRDFFVDTRLATYLPRMATFDFGESIVTKRPIVEDLKERVPRTMTLNILSILIAYLISIPVGVYSAVRPHSWLDRILTVVLFVLYSLPSFFVGVLLLVYCTRGSDYEWMRIFPTGGFTSSEGWEQWTVLHRLRDILWHAVLPVTTLTYASFAALSRYARSGLLEVIRADYVRTARAKGLPERTVVLVHALRNGLIPVVTLLGSILPALFGGSIVVEYIFAIPGMGTYLIDAINGRDFTVLISLSFISAILTLTGVLLVDIMYVMLDPRISFGKRS